MFQIFLKYTEDKYLLLSVDPTIEGLSKSVDPEYLGQVSYFIKERVRDFQDEWWMSPGRIMPV